MKLLVTGVGGFIGRNLAERLAESHEVAAPTRAELDLLDEDAVCRYLTRGSFDAVVHAATVRSNRRLGASPEMLDHNVRMFLNLTRSRNTFGRLLFLGSGAVYDRRYPTSLVREDQFGQHVPTDPYGFSKYICARVVEQMNDAYELRLFGVFGPHEDWTVRYLSNACCRAVWDLPVILNRRSMFDYLDVADVADIVNWFLTAQPQHRAYNLCSGAPSDLRDLADHVVRASGKDLAVIVKQDGWGAEYSGSNERLMAELPLRLRPIGDSVRELYAWYLARKNEINPAELNFDA
jgi:GDP-L-fucose synthase